ncbi:MAG: acyl carrier protein [Parvicella sp.]|jgi:acyl carrier protein
MELSIENLKQLLAQTSSIGDDVLGFDDDKPLDDQGVDSLDTLDYLLKVEEAYSVAIPDEDIDKVNTINKLYNYLKNKI